MPDMITKPGIYRDFPTADYFSDPTPTPSLTQSIAKVLIERSPLHAMYEHPRLMPIASAETEEEKYEKAKAIGNAAHAILLGRGKSVAIGDFDSWRSDKSKAFRSSAEQAGQAPILAKHAVTAHDMVNAANAQMRDHPAAPLFQDGAGEVVIAWKEGGLWFRSMIDWLHDSLLLVDDFKTTGLSVAPHAVPQMMVSSGWDIQAAMIERGLDVLDPGNAGRRKFRFVAQENEPPYALTVCELPESAMTMGRKKLAYAVDVWTECMARGQWPGYPAETVYPTYPGWAETRWLDREVEHEERRARRPEPMLTSLMGG